MAAVRRTVRRVAIAVTCVAALVASPVMAFASMTPGQLVFVVKDQAGGAYYNVTTGARFALVAATAVPTVAIAGVATSDGLVLTADGQLLQPLADAAQGSPAAEVVSVARTTGVGSWEDASTGAQFELVDVRADLPIASEFALRASKDAILTINDKLLVPVQATTGLNQ